MMPHLGAFNRAPTIVGSEHPAPGIDFASMLKDLERRGHRFYFQPQISGVASIRVRRDFTGKRVLEAGIDPRREGAAAGY
jgi:gamma-glutamyltranspeptidase